jgi:hypothetical protein
MISDVLYELVNGIDWYLNDSSYDDIYQGKRRERIIRLRNEAEYLRVLLDAPPGMPPLPEPVQLERIAEQRTRRIEDRCYSLPSEAEALGWPPVKA